MFLFITSFSQTANAFYYQSGDNLILSSDKKINEVAVVFGSSLTIDADINGDLYCAGRDVVVNGDVQGDIVCAAQSLEVNGIVDGNVRALAQTVDVNGTVTRNLTVASQSLILDPKSQVKGDIFFGAQNVDLNGSMGRDLAGAGETITVTGSLLRNAVVTGTHLSVIETGKIGGNLDYYMEKTATASIGTKNVKGNVVRHEIVTPETPSKAEMTKVTMAVSVTGKIISIISMAIVGFLLIYFNKKKTMDITALISAQPVKSGFIGLVTLIVFPVIFILGLITVIGIPVSFIALFVYIIALITASLYTAIVFGRLLFEKVFRQTKSTIVPQMLLGTLILGLVSCIPVIGWAVAFVSFCVGLGAITQSYLSVNNK